MKLLKTQLSMLAGLLTILFILACASSDEGDSAAAAQVADMSQFPTPTGSRAQLEPTAQPETVQVQASQDANGADEDEPMSQAELQQLRQRLQSGELSEEEAQQSVQRLRQQFGDGPGRSGGSQVSGSIESVEESIFTVATELASVSVSVGADTIIRVTSVLEPAALTDGSQVMVVSERLEGSTLARAITIIPEDQARFRGGQGGFGGALGGLRGNQGGAGGPAGIFGAVTSVTDSGFTLETQQGPLPIVMNEESIILETRQGAFVDLEVGMQVRVTGPADENGSIDARSVTVTPQGLEGLRGPGFGQ